MSFRKVEYVEENGIQYKKVNARAMGESDTYDLLMFFQGKGPTSKIWATCSCPYFLYHCEVALQKRGSTDINYSNGKLPKITNPRLVSHACKHIVSALQKGAFMLEPKKVVKKSEPIKPKPVRPAPKPESKQDSKPEKSEPKSKPESSSPKNTGLIGPLTGITDKK